MQDNSIEKPNQLNMGLAARTDEQMYQPDRDEFEQVKAELRALHGNLLMLYESKNVGFDQIHSLVALSQKLEDANAKLKMLIRNLKLRQTSLIQ